MNNRIVLLCIVCTFTLLIFMPTVRAQGAPNPPCLFYGYVYVGGNLAQDGLNVTAVISGTTLSWTTQTGNGTYGWPVLGSSISTNGFKIPSTDPSNSTKTGGVTGDHILFYVQGVQNAQTDYFDVGGAKRFDLSVPSISMPSGGSRDNSTLTVTLDQSVYSGDKVDLSGRLTFVNGTSIGGASLSVTCMTVPGAHWDTVASATTSTSGFYIAQWTPNASTSYLVKVSWIGSADVQGSEANLALAITAPENAYVFSVVSNSTVQDLVYNSTFEELNFTVIGPEGTTGFTDVAVPKDLIQNITGLTVHIDQNTVSYTNTSNPTSWILHFTYTQSIHFVTINLPAKPAPAASSNFLQTPIGIVTLIVAIGFAAAAGIYVARGKLKQPNEKPTKSQKKSPKR